MQDNAERCDRDGGSDIRWLCAGGIARRERRRREMGTRRSEKLLETPVTLEGGAVTPACPLPYKVLHVAGFEWIIVH